MVDLFLATRATFLTFAKQIQDTVLWIAFLFDIGLFASSHYSSGIGNKVYKILEEKEPNQKDEAKIG